MSASRKEVCVAIPASVVSDVPHLREKTSKIGLVGRAAAIFRISEIIIYQDNPRVDQKRELDLIADLLAYMETPQYLRKSLFKIKPELQYAGILPPLRTPHHPLNRLKKNLKAGEFREGVALSNTKEGAVIDVGVDVPALLPNKQLPTGKRVTVKITGVNGRVFAETANRDEIPDYWGYTVVGEHRGFGEFVESRRFDLAIATSKRGVPFADVAERIGERWKNARSILIGFGAPTQGLYEIVKREGRRLEDVADFVVNTIPVQGTETVRTEEALLASLAILNLRFGF